MRTTRNGFVRAADALASFALAGLLITLAGPAQGATWTEIGDAGESLLSADATTGVGSLDAINGNLVELAAGIDDVDLYQIRVVDPEAFAVVVTADLSGDNDGALFLFDEAGFFVLFDDDDGAGFLPEFAPGELAGAPAGIYYLSFSIFATEPIVGPGLPLSGWERDPDPLQTGPYTLSLSGVEFSVVPVPPAAALFGSALALLGWLRGRTTKH